VNQHAGGIKKLATEPTNKMNQSITQSINAPAAARSDAMRFDSIGWMRGRTRNGMGDVMPL